MTTTLSMFGLLLMGTSSALAQDTPIDPPVADRPADFSNIVGQYKIEVSADPLKAEVEQPITLRIRIIGTGPEKYQPNRDHLRLFPAWENDFYVQEMRNEHQVLRGQKTWLFVYRLKPKHVNIDALEGIKLVYYDPKDPGKVKFVTDYADPIKIVVKPRAEAVVIVADGAVPDSFYAFAESSNVHGGPTTSFAPSSVQLGLLLAVPPLACLAGAFAWRRRFPDEAQRVRRQRREAAQRALARLQAGGVLAWDVVRDYLHERFDFNVEDPTPAEAAAFLRRRGFAKELCGKCARFFRACDAARYTAGARPEPGFLADDVVRLIQALEADPCTRG
jgi:hypothetical protein